MNFNFFDTSDPKKNKLAIYFSNTAAFKAAIGWSWLRLEYICIETEFKRCELES